MASSSSRVEVLSSCMGIIEKMELTHEHFVIITGAPLIFSKLPSDQVHAVGVTDSQLVSGRFVIQYNRRVFRRSQLLFKSSIVSLGELEALPQEIRNLRLFLYSHPKRKRYVSDENDIPEPWIFVSEKSERWIRLGRQLINHADVIDICWELVSFVDQQLG